MGINSHACQLRVQQQQETKCLLLCKLDSISALPSSSSSSYSKYVYLHGRQQIIGVDNSDIVLDVVEIPIHWHRENIYGHHRRSKTMKKKVNGEYANKEIV